MFTNKHPNEIESMQPDSGSGSSSSTNVHRTYPHGKGPAPASVPNTQQSEFPESVDVTMADRSAFFPPRNQANGGFPVFKRASLFEEDAFFAVQHGNERLLTLLLGPEDLEEDLIQLESLSEELIKLKNNLHKKNSREVFLDEELKNLNDRLKEGAIETGMQEQYQKGIDEQLNEARGFGDARATNFVNGEAVRSSDDERQAYLNNLQQQLESDKAAYFASTDMQEKIQDMREMTKSRRKEVIQEKAQLTQERKILEQMKDDKSMQQEDIKDKQRRVRDKAVGELLEDLKEDRSKFPQRYYKQDALALLMRASGAKLDINCQNALGNSLMHYAVKEAHWHIVDLLLTRGAISILFVPNNNQETAYYWAVKLGNNKIMQLISDHIVPPDTKDETPGLPAFYTPQTLREFKESEVAILSYAYGLIHSYRKNILPMRNSFWHSKSATAQREVVVEALQDELMPRAVLAQSYYFWELAATQAVNKLKTGLLNRSELRNILNSIKEHAKGELAARPYPSHLAEQVQSLIDSNHRLMARNAELESRQQSNAQQNPVVESLKRENRELREELKAQKEANESFKAKVEQFMAGNIAQPLPNTRETPAGESSATGAARVNFAYGATVNQANIDINSAPEKVKQERNTL